MPTWLSSLRSRLTAWYTILIGLPLVAFAIVCYMVFARTLQDRTDRFIGDALAAFSSELGAERRSALSTDDAMRRTLDEVRFRDLYIVILDSAGHVVGTTPFGGNPAVAPQAQRSAIVGKGIVEAIRARDPGKPQAMSVRLERSAYRAKSRPLILGGRAYVLAGAYSLDDIEGMLERIRRMFFVAIPFLLVCAATGGYVLAKRSLAPVSSMAAQAAAISAANLDERLPVGGGEELAGLARVVNELLNRLEGSFEQQRRFMADASHELRTPAAILRTEADVTLSREHRTEGEYRASATIMRDAARRLTRIVDDLFLLARADSGHLVPRLEPVYLEELVCDIARAVRPVGDQRSVRVEVRDIVEAPFQGDADLLGRLLLNLLDNAIKHSPAGSTVEIGVARHDGRYEISVSDQGEGIPEEAREHVFTRFFRVDAARSQSESSATAGAGLGLPIARRIAEIHGGRLDLVGSRAGRTEFRLTLPADRDRAGDA